MTMYIFQLNFRYGKGALLKSLLLLVIFISCLNKVQAQEKKNTKLLVETGFLLLSADSENLGIFINLEPKVKILENTFIGLKFGLALNAHTFEIDDPFQFTIDGFSDNGVVSFEPTFDYYLNGFYWNEKFFSPYIGLGLGYHILSDPDVFQVDQINSSEDFINVRVNKQVGVLLRGGLEFGKLRLGLEYSLIPKADIVVPSGEVIGRIDGSYLGLSIGLVIGGGSRPD